MNRYGNQKNSAGRYKLALIVVALIAFGLQWAFSNSTRPVNSLAEAIETLNSSKILNEDTSYLLHTASQNKMLEDWANYYSGVYHERHGEFTKALESYDLVNSSSPASLLAQVASLRIRGRNKLSNDSHKILSQAKTTAQQLNWPEVIVEIELIRAKDMLRAGESNLALTLLNTIRRANANPEITAEARNISKDLIPTLSSTTPSLLLEQAKLLNSEQKNEEALEIVALLKAELPENNNAYFEAMMIEESILRSMKRSVEADHLLLTISAHAQKGVADQALYRIAKNYWNINDHHRSLEFIQNFYSRFPHSTYVDDVRYMEARILEETNAPKEAFAAYSQLSKSTVNPNLRYSAVKRLGWLTYLAEDYRDSLSYFKNADKIASKALKENNEQGLSFSDVLHAKYWAAVSYEKLGDANEAVKIFEEIFELDPIGYYRMLAAKKINQTILPAMHDETLKCLAPIPEQLEELLTTLKSAKIDLLIQREVDWHLLHNLGSLDKARLPKALLLSRFAGADKAIRSASAEFKFAAREERKFDCHEKLFNQSFPLAYRETILEYSEEANVDPALVFAVARTESHFIPTAKSNRDASGLMQLIEKTAKEEGLEKDEFLTDPNVNIRLGSKHLRRLLDQFPESAQAVAAYNAGPGPVNRWIDRQKNLPIEEWIELIGYPETLNYVKSVVAARAAYTARLTQTTNEAKE